ncbi:MAG: hypothetical protein KDD38_06860 [Bdellovibrionales bacterium]|nr:hypothetical protein [Bdellovibrionales bacterium]
MSKSQSHNHSFQSILEEKLALLEEHDNFSTNSVIKSDVSFDFSYEKIDFVTFTPSKASIINQATPSYFNKKNKKRPTQTAKKPIQNEPIFSIEELSFSAQLATQHLGVALSPDGRHIKISAVKRAFRQKARECHPDLNPDLGGQKFNEYRLLSEIILNELKSLGLKTTEPKAA